jgi:branched-subunit amino acid transport protein AzlD
LGGAMPVMETTVVSVCCILLHVSLLQCFWCFGCFALHEVYINILERHLTFSMMMVLCTHTTYSTTQ